MAREIEKEAYKRIPLEILLHVTDFCEKNQIRYSLAYGTLLGAIRHKGFIPWDDDIDIIMPRVDYERFKKLYHSERYIFSDLSINTNHPTGMGKVYDSQTYYYFNRIKRSFGLFIDVFVVDNFPVDIIERRKWINLMRLLIKISNSKNISFINLFRSQAGFLRTMRMLFFKILPISQKVIQKKITDLAQKYNGRSTGIVGITMSVDNPYDTYPSVFFEDVVDVEFEKHIFKAIRRYDDWLKKCYGEYMQLPPVEKRVGRHGIKAFYKQ